ncbi:ABC transporter ATP-binding protein [Propioniciclava soli]|uniref:ABC transporter ATP-binding protein n=1 Tax=Propioniciclava soli TaxID=2775081 RepID=A0ABZ3CD84_9ACTN|nr:ABC transporter ATP-binding protein [Propioniciclava soli]
MVHEHAPRGAQGTAGEVVVRVSGVGKDFVLRHTRSLKEALVWLVRGRKGDLANHFHALDDVTFDIHHGETVALMGLNGSGKSTTLKLISGVMRPDRGSVGVRGRIAGLIEVGAGFHPDLPGRDNVYLNGAILGMTHEEIDARFDDILAFSEIGEFIDTEVKFYSSGMYLRLAFAVAVHTDPDVFLVDEILAVGDEPFQRKCIGRIKELVARGKTLVVVSHDLDLVQQICERGIVMESGRVVFDGPCREAVTFLRERNR